MISAPRRCWEPGAAADGARDEHANEIGGRAASPRRSPRSVAGTIDGSLRLLGGRPWGLFAPVYALRSRRDWGAGDLADLEALAEWTGEQGGSLVATLPLLSASFGEGADPSPYRPLSRLFWNEFFLAPEGVEEWASCPAAQRLANAAETEKRRDALREMDVVDYQAVMALKRPVIEELARCFFEQAGEARRQDYEDYLRDNPFARDYAAFRAAEESGRPAGDAGPGGGARDAAGGAVSPLLPVADGQAARGAVRRGTAGAAVGPSPGRASRRVRRRALARSCSRRASPPGHRRTCSSPTDRTGPPLPFAPRRTGAMVTPTSAPACAT